MSHVFTLAGQHSKHYLAVCLGLHAIHLSVSSVNAPSLFMDFLLVWLFLVVCDECENALAFVCRIINEVTN